MHRLWQKPGAVAAFQAVQRGYITIKALCDRSGVHKQTIHYYLRKQLLPPPVRTSKTSALYPPSAIELLKLVRSFQDRRRSTLEEIAAIFRRCDYDPQMIRRGLDAEFTPAVTTRADAPPWLTADEAVAAVDPAPPAGWLEEIRAAGLVDAQMQDGKPVYSPNSVGLIRSVCEGRRLGATLAQFQTLAKLVEAHAEGELQQFLAAVHDIPLSNDAYPQVARLFNAFERFGSYRRKAALHSKFIGGAYEHSRYLFVGPNRKYVFPSETFLVRMGLNREIDRLALRLDKHPDDLAALKDLARAYNLRSDWVHLHETAQEILRLDPNDPMALANLGQALSYLGRDQESVAVLEQGLKRTPNSLVKLRLGQSLVMLARKTGDAAQLFDAIVKKARLAAQAIKESQHTPSLRRKIRLILALDNMGLSDPLGVQGPSVEDLERLYAEFHSLPDKQLTVLTRISLSMARMFSAYALYLVRERQHHPDAERLRRQIVQADPNGVLAARSARIAAQSRPGNGRKSRSE
jgi:DNA-binding transcriptional MerR regulator/tetratricopeptide (TPR) repeat protein